MSKKKNGESKIFAILSIIVVLIFLGLPLLSNKNSLKTFLEDQGYQNVKINGINYFSCGSGDLFKDGFSATNINGKEVKGTICSGLFKGKTIRFD